MLGACGIPWLGISQVFKFSDFGVFLTKLIYDLHGSFEFHAFFLNVVNFLLLGLDLLLECLVLFLEDLDFFFFGLDFFLGDLDFFLEYLDFFLFGLDFFLEDLIFFLCGLDFLILSFNLCFELFDHFL